MFCPSQKIFSRWPERKGHMKDPHSPTTIFSCSHGTAKNVIKSTSVFGHTAWTVGSWAFSMESSIVFSCYWTRIKYGFACSFLCTNNVYLFSRPDWRPSLTLLLEASAFYWAHVKSSSFREGPLICSMVIFKAQRRPELSLGELEKTWAGHQKTWALELVLPAP